MRICWVPLAALLLVAPACSGGGSPSAATRPTAAPTLVAPSTAPGSTSAPSITPGTAAPTVTAAPAARTSAQIMCGTTTVTSAGRVRSDALSEISGVAASRRVPDVWWVHNDSGATATVYAIDTGGTLRATVDVVAADAVDWEDIAAGPGPEAGVPYLFAADIGDNGESRDHVGVFRFVEPDLAATTATADLVTLRYPDRAHNAEAFMVHPVTGDWYVLTKESRGASMLFRAARPGPGASTVRLESVASLDVRPDYVTGGDIAPDGSAVAIRTYLSLRIYPVTNGDVAAALAGTPCRVPFVVENQGEAVAFGADGRAMVTISEGDHPAVNVIR